MEISKDSLYITPGSFAEMNHVIAGFSTRYGGVSPSPYSSLNLGLSTEDDRERVLENRQRLFSSMGFPQEHLAITGQVHGTEILEVDEPGLYRGYDGLISKRRGLMLCLSAADCASVLLADPKHEVIAACHAGWRGTVGRIVEKTINALVGIGGNPSDIRAYVSPCISVHHFEVGEEVAELFDSKYVERKKNRSKPHVDLKAAIRDQLFGAGILLDHIEISPFCTFANKNDFFSYRRERGKTGRLMGFIALRT